MSMRSNKNKERGFYFYFGATQAARRFAAGEPIKGSQLNVGGGAGLCASFFLGDA